MYVHTVHKTWTFTSRPGLLNFLFGVGKSDKILRASRQHKSQHTQWRVNKHTYNCYCNFTCVFFNIASPSGRSPAEIVGSNPTGDVDVCLLSGRGLCDEPITRPEESYRLWCVIVWSRKPHEWGGPGPVGAVVPPQKNIYICISCAKRNILVLISNTYKQYNPLSRLGCCYI
jgi:hypothetical protein